MRRVWPHDGVSSKKKKSCWEATGSQVPARDRSETTRAGKGGKGKKGASSLDEWPDGQEDQRSDTKTMRRSQVSSSVLSADTKGITDETGKPGKDPETGAVSVEPTRMETYTCRRRQKKEFRRASQLLHIDFPLCQ